MNELKNRRKVTNEEIRTRRRNEGPCGRERGKLSRENVSIKSGRRLSAMGETHPAMGGGERLLEG